MTRVTLVLVLVLLLAFVSACASTRVPLDRTRAADGDGNGDGVDASGERASLARTVQVLVGAGYSNRDRESALLARIRELGLSARRESIDWWSPHDNLVIDLPSTTTTTTMNGADAPLVYLVAHYDKTSITPLSIPALLSNGALDEVTGMASFSEGATDNATGVAVVLEVAKHLARTKSHASRYRVLLAGQEEMGLRGSRAHVAQMSIADQRATAYVVNVDTVGVADRENCIMTDATEHGLAVALHDAASELGVSLGDAQLPFTGTSDHAPFREWSAAHDVAFGLLANATGGLVPQRSWSVRPRRARTAFLSTCGITDVGDDVAGLVLLPLGRLHGFRDRADAVDADKLHDAYRIVARTVRSLDGPR
jgi:hypothetical protein